MAAWPDTSVEAPVFSAEEELSFQRVYETVADPQPSGRVGAAAGAEVLRRSGLPHAVLGRIWGLADGQQEGALSREGFFSRIAAGRARAGWRRIFQQPVHDPCCVPAKPRWRSAHGLRNA